MRVLVLKSFVSPGLSYAAGEEADIPDSLAVEWVRVGFLQRLEPEPEVAVSRPAEVRTGRRERRA